MVVELESYEAVQAARVALDRHGRAVSRGNPDAYGAGADWVAGLQKHTIGALGEVAYAKATGRYWNGSVNTYKSGGDVGLVQVRTRTKAGYELIVRPDDPDDALFVLVRTVSGGSNRPRLDVVGSIMGRDAKRPEWLKNHGGRSAAYFVPDSALEPFTPLA